MKSLRIKNLRCLEDTGEIPLKDINILVGANSSGKSTFLRTFPLFKQGMNVRKKGPILWYGDSVDFGDFKTSVKTGENTISFEFVLHPQEDNIKSPYYRFTHQIEQVLNLDYKLNIDISTNNDYEYVSKVKISFYNFSVEIEVGEDRLVTDILINGRSYYNEITKDINLHILSPNDDIFEIYYTDKNSSKDNYLRSFKLNDTLKRIIIANIRPYIGNRVYDDTAIAELLQVKLASLESPISALADLNISSTWCRNRSYIKEDSKKYEKFIDAIVLSKFAYLCDALNHYLYDSLKEVYYIAPLRATAQRYYRMQNLSISEIDSAGQNLPLFLHNLTPLAQSKLSTWMNECFGFYPIAVSEGGHISLNLVDSNSKHNITDKGFGYSQILPIIVQLWTIVFKAPLPKFRKAKQAIVAIEQPELHLHPKLQAMLADAFVKITIMAREMNFDLKIIIETHSPTIINKLGAMVADGDIDAENLTVAMFGEEDGKHLVNLSNYDKDGVLTNWPIGFFDF